MICSSYVTIGSPYFHWKRVHQHVVPMIMLVQIILEKPVQQGNGYLDMKFGVEKIQPGVVHQHMELLKHLLSGRKTFFRVTPQYIFERADSSGLGGRLAIGSSSCVVGRRLWFVPRLYKLYGCPGWFREEE